MSVFAKVPGPIDLSVLTYDGYTLNPGESVLVTDETNPANTVIYWVTNDGVLAPDVNWVEVSSKFDLTLVTVLTDGIESARWWVARDGSGPDGHGGEVIAVEECLEINTSGLLEKLRVLDEQYLTVRILADLNKPVDSDDYAYAKAQWDKHEEEAEPIREILRQAAAQAAEFGGE
jgi:hypothetical protein